MVKQPSIILKTIYRLGFILLLASSSLWAASPLQTQCFVETGKYFNIDPRLLLSVAIVESNLNTKAIGVNTRADGTIISRDYGLMQINQRHIPLLKARGIIRTENDLLHDACLNIKVGAWILNSHFSRCGRNWPCLGSYNAGFSNKSNTQRKQYMNKVYGVYKKLGSLQ